MRSDADWLPGDGERRWRDAVTRHACRGTPEQWHATVRRHLTTLTRVATDVRTALRGRAGVDGGLVVVVLDDDPVHREDLARRCLDALRPATADRDESVRDTAVDTVTELETLRPSPG